MAVHTWPSLKQDPRRESALTILRYNTETSLQGAVVLIANQHCSEIGPSLVAVQWAVESSVCSTCALMPIHVLYL